MLTKTFQQAGIYFNNKYKIAEVVAPALSSILKEICHCKKWWGDIWHLLIDIPGSSDVFLAFSIFQIHVNGRFKVTRDLHLFRSLIFRVSMSFLFMYVFSTLEFAQCLHYLYADHGDKSFGDRETVNMASVKEFR